MSFNTCLLFWNDLLTPTIEKIIFLSSAIFFILVKLSILHSFHEIAVHHCLINQQACQQNERCSPELLSGDVFCVFPEEHAQHDARLPKQLIGVIARSALTVQRKTYHHPQELKQGETHVLGEATILKRLGDNDYLAEYNGVKCHAIFNPFAGRYFVDDVYGVIRSTPDRDSR